MMKRNEGFTLIELLVTLSAGALVTFAAVSLLLLGARVQYNTLQEADEQQTVRIVMSMMENMAGKGAFNEIVPLENNSWELRKCTDPAEDDHEHDGPVIFWYDASEGSIYRGEAGEGNTPLLTGLNNAIAIIEGDGKNVLRLSFETERGANYVSRVYCRTTEIRDGTNEDEENAADHAEAGRDKVGGIQARIKFLDALAGEYNDGQNTGVSSDGAYYSQWYIEDGWGKNGWNKDTPWCACFLSWAAVNMVDSTIKKDSPFVFANVDAGMAAFEAAGRWTDAAGEAPTPGDYIFFDWTGQKKDPAHVGVVLDVDSTDVYTIEGNSSGRVAVRKYSITDPVIMGYGVLPGFRITDGAES